MSVEQKRIVLYYADWCHHCQMMKPEWEKFKAVYTKSAEHIKKNYGVSLNIENYESEKDKLKIDPNTVQGFPTIHIIEGNNIINYDGERTASALLKTVVPHILEEDITNWLSGDKRGGADKSSIEYKYRKYKMKYCNLRSASKTVP